MPRCSRLNTISFWVRVPRTETAGHRQCRELAGGSRRGPNASHAGLAVPCTPSMRSATLSITECRPYHPHLLHFTVRTGALPAASGSLSVIPNDGLGAGGSGSAEKVQALSPGSDLLLVQGRFAPSERDGWKTGKVTHSQDQNVCPFHMNLL